ncbi:MAG: PssD/Cps14F family polysaccharide biosynthesis glycosyltransferase, partial [Thermodesulfobacteriota bacterium]
MELMEAFEGYDFFILSYDEQSIREFKNLYLIKNFSKNPIHFISGIIKIFQVLMKERPYLLFSSGAEIAIPAFYVGKLLFRTKLIYLECSAQVYHPSITGRIVYPISDLFLVQWPQLISKYGKKAKFVGGLI